MSGTTGKKPRYRYRPQDNKSGRTGRERKAPDPREAQAAQAAIDAAQDPDDPLASPVDRSRVSLSSDPAERLRQIRTIYGRDAAKEEAIRLVSEFLAIGMTRVSMAQRLGVNVRTVAQWVDELRSRMGEELRDKVDPFSLAGRILGRIENTHQKAMAMVHSQDTNLRYANRLRALELAEKANMDMLGTLERMGVFEGMHINTDAAQEDPAAMAARTASGFFKDFEKEVFGLPGEDPADDTPDDDGDDHDKTD